MEGEHITTINKINRNTVEYQFPTLQLFTILYYPPYQQVFGKENELRKKSQLLAGWVFLLYNEWHWLYLGSSQSKSHLSVKTNSSFSIVHFGVEKWGYLYMVYFLFAFMHFGVEKSNEFVFCLTIPIIHHSSLSTHPKIMADNQDSTVYIKYCEREKIKELILIPFVIFNLQKQLPGFILILK